MKHFSFFAILLYSISTLLPVFICVTSGFAQYTKPSPRAFLSLTTSKNEVLPGECAVITYSFNIYRDNQIPIQFHDLATQYYNQISYFYFDSVINYNSHIRDIKGLTIAADKDTLTTYKIFEGGICPIYEGSYEIPSLTLEMLQFRFGIKAKKGNDSVRINYYTEPVTIRAKSFKKEIYDSISVRGIPVTGDFQTVESIQRNHYFIDESFEFKLSVEGHGVAHFLSPRINPCEFADILLSNEENENYVRDNKIVTRKTITYKFIPKKTGLIKFNEIFEPVYYYNLKKQRIDSIAANTRVQINQRDTVSSKPVGNAIDSTTNSSEVILLLLDISNSMNIEDYKPSRLAYLKNEIKKLHNRDFPIEIVLFAGAAKPLDTFDFSSNIDSINSSLVKTRGTALGDAIWYALDRMDRYRGRYLRRLIMMGDGDNTTGFLSPSLASQVAYKSDLRIYTVGIGTAGTVSYQNMSVSNTFLDTYFKQVSENTGGNYFWLSPSGSLEEIFRTILSDP